MCVDLMPLALIDDGHHFDLTSLVAALLVALAYFGILVELVLLVLLVVVSRLVVLHHL